ncbi:hypothetical protein C7B82_02065 [Stenomitos frigidus ULC18]|uniref:Uncharacterized protein n=2 Tax=Stenomitos TaxID=1844270 RepID=A0A2T1EPI3_9CYAN|nr:hypothetical protein C7B82_02065 [Stenomitos frigidus ULC18]
MTPESVLPVVSPPVLVTLFTGLLIAFAVQLLMTTFGIAAGMTALGFLPSGQSTATEADASAETSSGTAGKIGFAIGAGTLLTVNSVLFTACFLAVKLSVVGSVTLGAVLGVVIWSGYFLVLTWLSSKAAGSLLGVLAGAFSAGVQGLMTTVMSALRRHKGREHNEATLPEVVNKRLATTEATLSTLQEQLDTNHHNLEATLQEYVQTLQPPKPDLQSIRQEVAAVLANAGLPSVSKTGLGHIDRQAFVDLVSSRTDFSKRDVTEIVDQLEGVWQEVVETPDPIADITTFLQTASPEVLTPTVVNDRLQKLLSNAQSHAVAGEHTTQSMASPLEPMPLLKQLVRTVRDRVDLSDLDVGGILQQLHVFMPSSDPSDADRVEPFNATIKADVEAYLLNAYPWNLTRKTVQAEFTDVIYDPEANPVAVKNQLLSLDRDVFVALLEQRDDLSAAKVSKIADRLEAVRQEVLKTLDTAIAEAPMRAFSQQIAASLQAVSKAELQPATFQQQLQTHLADSEQWSDRLESLDRNSIAAMLNDRPDLNQKEVEALATEFETARDRLLTDLQQREADAKAEAVALWQMFGEYVGDHDQKLTARTIQRQLKTLTKVVKTDLSSVYRHLPSFDRVNAEQWLNEREDLTEKQRKRILPQLEKAWSSLHTASHSLEETVVGSPQLLTVLMDYIQRLDPETLSMDDLPKDLYHYLQQQHVDVDWLGQLTQIEWKPLLEEVQQRSDLTAEQQQRLLHSLQRSLYTMGKLPRRLALRSKRQVQNWQDHLSDYLRHAEREDLSPDRLPQLIQYLLANAQTASGVASDWLETQHLSIPSRDGLITLLSERGDMTAAEINEIMEQVEAALQYAIAQAQALQQQVQETLVTTFDKLRHVVTSLPLPELDYDRIKQDLQQLFVDPRAGLESLSSSLGDTLRGQLSTLNRDSLAALISTRDDLSNAFTEQVVDRIDTVRLAALSQIETIQQGAQHRLEELKQQAQQQAEETRKAVAIAAWWLFVTAFSSALTAAIAGALAVGGSQWFEQWLVP